MCGQKKKLSSHGGPRNKLVPVRIPSDVFLCISRFHELCKKRKKKKKREKIKASCDRETESYIRRSSVLQKGDILNSFISVSGSASTAPSM